MKQIGQLLTGEVAGVTFLDWYSTFPKKANKVKAEALWNKLSDLDKHKAIVDIPERLERHQQWSNKQFIPAPDVYLRNKKWTDEMVQAKTKENEQEEIEDGSLHARFWTLLKQCDSRLERAYGGTMPYAWKASLKDITGREVAKIMSYLTNDKDPLIITLRKINEVRRIGREFWEPKQILIENITKPETFKTNIEQMKEMLK